MNENLESIVRNTYAYLSNKQRLKALGVLGACAASVILLKEKLPLITQYFREVFPSLTDESVSLSVDTITNTIAAPMGFLLSNYANEKTLNKKELIGQVAFAFGWGIIRHYIYSGLSSFDEVTLPNAAAKVGLYTAYYVAYGALYSGVSEFLSRASHGESYISSAKKLKIDLPKRLRLLTKDPGIQFNLVMNIANMFNPWVESRPTIAGILLIDYNMNVIKHSHQRTYGFWNYVRKTLANE